MPLSLCFASDCFYQELAAGGRWCRRWSLYGSEQLPPSLHSFIPHVYIGNFGLRTYLPVASNLDPEISQMQISKKIILLLLTETHLSTAPKARISVTFSTFDLTKDPYEYLGTVVGWEPACLGAGHLPQIISISGNSTKPDTLTPEHEDRMGVWETSWGVDQVAWSYWL